MRERERWIASMWMRREMVHYCFFLVPPREGERDGLLLLLLPLEEEDCSFCMKEMIASFSFTWDQGFASHMKAWNTGSFSSCYRLMGKQEQCEDDNVKIWQQADSSPQWINSCNNIICIFQYPTSKQHYLSIIHHNFFSLRKLGDARKINWWESKPGMSTAYGNFIGATLSNRHFQKQGNMSYLLPDSLLHLRTILKDQQQLYHDILHFADNEIQVPCFLHHIHVPSDSDTSWSSNPYLQRSKPWFFWPNFC